MDTLQLHIPHKQPLLALGEVMVRTAALAKPTSDTPDQNYDLQQQNALERGSS